MPLTEKTIAAVSRTEKSIGSVSRTEKSIASVSRTEKSISGQTTTAQYTSNTQGPEQIPVQWALNGVTHWQAVNSINTRYVSALVSGITDHFSMTDPPVTVDEVTKAVVTFSMIRVLNIGAPAPSLQCSLFKDNGATQIGAQTFALGNNPNPHTFTYTFSGLSLTDAEARTLSVKAISSGTWPFGQAIAQLEKVQMEVTYSSVTDPTEKTIATVSRTEKVIS